MVLYYGRQEGHPACENWVVGCWHGVCLEQGADLHVAQLMPLPLTVSCFSKIQIGLPFWYRLIRVVPEKEPLNGCVYGLVLYDSSVLLWCCIWQQDVLLSYV